MFVAAILKVLIQTVPVLRPLFGHPGVPEKTLVNRH